MSRQDYNQSDGCHVISQDLTFRCSFVCQCFDTSLARLEAWHINAGHAPFNRDDGDLLPEPLSPSH